MIAGTASLASGCRKTAAAQRTSHKRRSIPRSPTRAERTQRDAADSRRKPGPLIGLAGDKPGDKVFDLIPGTGYWTRIFSKIVGTHGKVYAVWPKAYAREAIGNVGDLRKLSADKYYGNIVTEVQPSTTLAAPEPLDVVWTSQNFHDYPDEFMGKGDPSSFANEMVQDPQARRDASWSSTIWPSRGAA